MNIWAKVIASVLTALFVGGMVAIQKDAPGWAAYGFGLSVGWQVWLWLNRGVVA